MESATKDYIFIGLVILEILFLAFIFVVRYMTRNDDHDHHHDDEEA